MSACPSRACPLEGRVPFSMSVATWQLRKLEIRSRDPPRAAEASGGAGSSLGLINEERPPPIAIKHLVNQRCARLQLILPPPMFILSEQAAIKLQKV